ncbi:MAG: PAS domain S-box protein [Candidatus Delongbacteria bacterium]|nr:PAS domain S-box protein [Candidatus Delongbacteria bacterium]
MQGKINILIVEDNEDHVFLIKQMLLKIPSDSVLYFEYDIKNADSLGSAIEVLEKNKIDVILLDLGLPDSKDLESLEKILSIYPEMPIIIQTALGRPDIIMNSLNNGAEDYLIKGEYTSTLLIRSIRHSIERRKALVQTLHSREQLRTLVEKNFNPMFVIDEENIIQDINESAITYFGKRRDELIGNKYGYSYDVNEKIEININEDNKTAIAEVRTLKIKWEDEDSFLITLNDITELKNKEAGLKKEVETFQSFFSDNKLIMLLVDPETGKISQANPTASYFYGYTVEELENMTLSDITDMSEDEVMEENMNALSEQRYNIIQSHRLKNNDKKKVEIFKGNINLTNRIMDYYIIHEINQSFDRNIEITDQKFYDLANNLNSIVTLWDENKEIIFVNSKFSDFFKVNLEIVMGTNVCRYLGFEDTRKLDIDQFKENKYLEFENSLNDANDEEHYLHWKNIVLDNGAGFLSIGNILQGK